MLDLLKCPGEHGTSDKSRFVKIPPLGLWVIDAS
jgi:hypothetical protein